MSRPRAGLCQHRRRERHVGTIDYGTASGAPGTVIMWTAFRGNAYVASGTVPTTTIADGDSFSINAGSLNLNGSTT